MKNTSISEKKQNRNLVVSEYSTVTATINEKVANVYNINQKEVSLVQTVNQ